MIGVNKLGRGVPVWVPRLTAQSPSDNLVSPAMP